MTCWEHLRFAKANEGAPTAPGVFVNAKRVVISYWALAPQDGAIPIYCFPHSILEKNFRFVTEQVSSQRDVRSGMEHVTHVGWIVARAHLASKDCIEQDNRFVEGMASADTDVDDSPRSGALHARRRPELHL
jgi:hypothetical protein